MTYLPTELSKEEARREMIKRRDVLSRLQRKIWSSSIRSRVLEFIHKDNIKHIISYNTIKTEVETAGLNETLLNLGVVLGFPAVVHDQLVMREVKDLKQGLISGRFGVMEPHPDNVFYDLDKVELVLTPGVCFDSRGHRLGYGGGYYDTFLSELRRINPKCTVLGLCFEMQIVNNLQIIQPFDQQLDGLISEIRTYHFV